MRALPEKGFAGVNLTVPHKEAAMSIADEISPEARRIGAVNTIFVTADGRLKATNTDAYGFITSLKVGAPRFDPKSGTAIILGAGGAARAVCVALQDAGVTEICIINRTTARAENLARDLARVSKSIAANCVRGMPHCFLPPPPRGTAAAAAAAAARRRPGGL